MSESTTPANKFGTIVYEEEVIRFSQIPPGIRVYLDAKKKIVVRFLTTGTVVPFEHPLVNDYLYTTLAIGKNRAPKKEEMELYVRRTRLTALGDVEVQPDTPEWWEAQLWSETVVLAALNVMEVWYVANEGKAGLSQTFSLSNWREKLVSYAEQNQLDYSKWDKGSHFHGCLFDQAKLFEHFNLKLSVEARSAAMRKTSITFIDETKIKGWNGLVVTR